MIVFPHPDPIAFDVFGFGVRWYGIMYLTGFLIAWGIGSRFVRKTYFSSLRGIVLEDLIIAAAFGAIFGGRLGYVLFYNFSYFSQNLLDIARIWTGGMSFHGGLIGVIIAFWFVAKAHAIVEWGETKEERALEQVTSQKNIFLRLIDFGAIITPPALGLGRLGNFINAELPGRVASADLPWAMSFGYPDFLPRHPSQLYQMAIEGIILTIIMLWLARRARRPGWLAGMFLILYGIGRFFVEFFREPDAHLGLLFFDLSMGQWLSIPMILIGVLLAYHAPLLRATTQKREKTSEGFWYDALFSEPDTRWNERETTFAEQYGDESEITSSRTTEFFSYLFGTEKYNPDEDEDDTSSSRRKLTRRQKRRLKKKKRKR